MVQNTLLQSIFITGKSVHSPSPARLLNLLRLLFHSTVQGLWSTWVNTCSGHLSRPQFLAFGGYRGPDQASVCRLISSAVNTKGDHSCWASMSLRWHACEPERALQQQPACLCRWGLLRIQEAAFHRPRTPTYTALAINLLLPDCLTLHADCIGKKNAPATLLKKEKKNPQRKLCFSVNSRARSLIVCAQRYKKLGLS